MRLRYYFQFRELIYEKMSFRAHIIPLKANISLFAAPAGMRRRTAAPHLPAARPDVALRRRMLSRMRCFAAAPERVILRLRKYKGTGASERAEFYCEINIFFCEWNFRSSHGDFPTCGKPFLMWEKFAAANIYACRRDVKTYRRDVNACRRNIYASFGDTYPSRRGAFYGHQFPGGESRRGFCCPPNPIRPPSGPCDIA